jgi:hypothetical protein
VRSPYYTLARLEEEVAHDPVHVPSFFTNTDKYKKNLAFPKLAT